LHLNNLFHKLFQNWPLKIIALSVALLLFLFNQMATLEERFMSVPLELRMSERFIPAESYPKTVRITLRGKSEEVNLVLKEDVIAYADFRSFDQEGSYTVPVNILKQGSLTHIEPLEIRVEPRQLNLRIEKKMSKSVQVEPSLIGYPAKGYELSQFFLTPSSVEIEGLESTIRELKSVETETIDLSGRQEDFTMRVRLKHPDQFSSFPGGDTVEFFGMVKESTILKTIENIDLIALDLDNELEVAGLPQNGNMSVQGTQLVLERLAREEFMLTIDCSQIDEPGTYRLPVRPDVPQGVLVLKYSPSSVEIAVDRAEDRSEETTR